MNGCQNSQNIHAFFQEKNNNCKDLGVGWDLTKLE
jgi:hypothetical protein